MNEQEKDIQQQELDDVEIAELARQELSKKDAEINKLKRELAKSKLLSVPEEEEEKQVSKEECLKVLFDPNVCNYDYAVAVLDLVDIETKAGRKNPLGKNGDAVYDFFDECLAACNGDKTKFPAVYQAKIGNDELPSFRNKRR